MTEEWISKSIDKFTIEELEELDYHRRFTGLNALVGFIAGLFPQYTLLTHPYLKDYKSHGIKSRLCLFSLMFLPIASSYLLSRPAIYYQNKYLQTLKEKYTLPELV